MNHRRILAGLISVQAILLIAGITRQSLWLDEIMTYDTVQYTWPELWNFFGRFPEQHPLYYLLLRLWPQVGTPELWLRALSAVFALACTPLLFLLARRLVGETTALISAALLVFSPFFLYYGQEGRMYTLLMLCSIASTLAFVTWRQDGGRAPLAGYVIASVLGMYTHFFFIFLLFAHVVAAALDEAPRRWAAARQTVLANLVVGVAYAPWAVFMATHGGGGRGQDWKSGIHVVLGIPYTLLRFSVGYAEVLANYGWKSQQATLIRQDAAVLLPAMLVFALLVLAGIRELARRGWSGRMTLTGLAAPMGAALLASVAVILVGERYFIVSFPFFLITIAVGIQSLRLSSPRWLAIAAVVGYGAVAAKTLADYYRRPEFGKEQWREAVAYVLEHRAPGEPVLVSPRVALAPFHHYFLRKTGENVPYAPPESLSAVRGDRFWLVTAYGPNPDSVVAGLEPTRRASERKFFPKESGIWVYHVTREPLPAVSLRPASPEE